MTPRARRSLTLTLALASALALGPTPAAADTPPTVWDYARDPDERGRWALHVRVERLLHPPLLDEDSIGTDVRRDSEVRLEAARAMLEQADAAHSPDVRLRFDLGNVYETLADEQGRVDLHQKAIDVLAPALEAAPGHPAATDALRHLVYALAHLGRPRDELAAWRRYIPRVTDDRARAVDLMDMGEAEMRLGLLDDALGTFQESLRLCEGLPNTDMSETYVLALWDRAVALDRSGDPRGALDDAAHALRINLGASNGGDLIESSPSVFFVPEWERRWYLALKYAAKARDAKDARDAVDAWKRVAGHWDVYIQQATASGTRDPYLAIAKVRREHVALELAAAEKRAAKLPQRPPPRSPWLGE
jgi:tetratricopeptide (TPR) repeat protein